MSGEEFKQQVKKLAKKNNVEYRLSNRGKGSHSTVCYGEKRTTVKHGEIQKGLLSTMCKQLGIDKKELLEA
ncbi:MAG: type II toxin-antitoxin system HicA family toxin [Leptolyngbya sp. SIO1E4]|nr:type II toxin-antitoxin system HicA family toxin [Leptolyngbya sp. SIO1E4]